MYINFTHCFPCAVLSQAFLMKLVYKPLVAIGIYYDDTNNVAVDGATLAFVLIWMLCTKMRDYNRAVKREQASSKTVDTLCACAEIV